MKARLTAGILAMAMLLSACEDEGNAGNDNLLTGGSLVVIVIIVIIVLVMRSRRH